MSNRGQPSCSTRPSFQTREQSLSVRMPSGDSWTISTSSKSSNAMGT
ncbi:Uncharacterised protein [Mycobacteroides abscessus subsp. abscessus]|nr:Uncharacterised protein [Mycobacteroides abscessus subsp. abscessus]